MNNTVNFEGLTITVRSKRITYLEELIKILDSTEKTCATIRIIEPPPENIVRSNHVIVSLIIKLISVEAKEGIAFLEMTAALDNNEVIDSPKQMFLLSEYAYSLMIEDVKANNIKDGKGNLLHIPYFSFGVEQFEAIIGKHVSIGMDCEER